MNLTTDEDISRTLPGNIRRVREAAGLSQKELSDATGVGRGSLCHYEAGRCHPRIATLARVAAALGVTMAHLLTPLDQFHAHQ
jgi:transcriptional regulator with XRE-family HTH domain